MNCSNPFWSNSVLVHLILEELVLLDIGDFYNWVSALLIDFFFGFLLSIFFFFFFISNIHNYDDFKIFNYPNLYLKNRVFVGFRMRMAKTFRFWIIAKL